MFVPGKPFRRLMFAGKARAYPREAYLGGAEVRISGGSYKRSFVYAELRIQYTNSYTAVVYCIRNDIEEIRIQLTLSYTVNTLS